MVGVPSGRKSDAKAWRKRSRWRIATGEERLRFDKNRVDRKVSNKDRESLTDLDARIAKMKNGTTYLAAEHVVDLNSEFLLAAVICHADRGDSDTLVDRRMRATLARLYLI